MIEPRFRCSIPGRKARIVVDNNTDTGNQFAYLQTNGVDVHLKGGSGLLHHKYAIVDGDQVAGTQYLVTGSHKYPSDISRPGMLYGKILRPPSYGAKLISVDLGPGKAMKDVVVLQDEQFVGVAAPSTFEAERAIAAIAETAKWEQPPHPSSASLYDYLKQHAQGGVLAIAAWRPGLRPTRLR